MADGYLTRRIIVLDADTGVFKRMWGAYGNVPDDAAPNQSFSIAFSRDAGQRYLFLFVFLHNVVEV